MINDMSLPASKLVRLTDLKTGVQIEVKQEKRRNKYYALSELRNSEPKVYETIIRIESVLSQKERS